MQGKKNLWLILGYVFLFQSCENMNDPGEIEFRNSVIFKLQTGNVKQKLYVYHTFPISFSVDDPIFSDNFTNPLAEDAKISIIKEDEIYTDFGIEYSDSTKRNKYYTNNGDFFVEPNTEYAILIESNGQTIRGYLSTIGDFEILSIDKYDYKEDWQSIINIKWEHCENAMFYLIKVTYFYSYIFPEATDTLKGLRGEYLEMFNPDTLKNIYSRELIIIKPDSLLTLEIEAYDQNSYDYYIKKIKKVGIENAYGYLGSCTIKKRKMYF